MTKSLNRAFCHPVLVMITKSHVQNITVCCHGNSNGPHYGNKLSSSLYLSSKELKVFVVCVFFSFFLSFFFLIEAPDGGYGKEESLKTVELKEISKEWKEKHKLNFERFNQNRWQNISAWGKGKIVSEPIWSGSFFTLASLVSLWSLSSGWWFKLVNEERGVWMCVIIYMPVTRINIVEMPFWDTINTDFLFMWSLFSDKKFKKKQNFTLFTEVCLLFFTLWAENGNYYFVYLICTHVPISPYFNYRSNSIFGQNCPM